MISTNIYNYLTFHFGEDQAIAYSDFVELEPAMYLRVNTLKNNTPSVRLLLHERYGIETEEVAGIPDALIVTKNRELVSRAVEHIMGEFYIQSLSSMIPPIILDPQPGEKILDLCAAPGSKTTQIAGYMQNRGTLIANEIQLDRIKILVYNVDRMNVLNTAIVHSKGELLSKIYNGYFDKILVDAPCSGMGIAQKKGEVKAWWNIKKSQILGDLQLKLLISAIKMVKVGGEIVYSTCTMSIEENELVINKVLTNYPVEPVDIELPLKSHPGVTKIFDDEFNPSLTKARRIVPWEVNSEGFFIIKLRKTEETVPHIPISVRPVQFKLIDYSNKEIHTLLKNTAAHFGIPEEHMNDFRYIKKGTDIYIVGKEFEDEHLGLFERIGTRFGIIDKNDEITLHTQSAQVFRKYITKHIYKLRSVDEFKVYIEGGTIKTDIPIAQYVVEYNGSLLGSAIMTESGLKSRFPKAKRSQSVLFIPDTI